MHDNYIDIYPDTHWHRPYWHNDTEAAAIPRPGESCCGSSSGDECVCVTSGDVELWNQVSAISSISGLDWDSLSSLSGLNNSADLWNRNFVTVYNNSAAWNNINELSGIVDASELWNNASNIVQSHSANWNDAYQESFKINELSADISALSSIFNRQLKLYFSNSLSGDGTQNTPYGVIHYKEYTDLVNNLNNEISKLFKADGTQNWITLDAEDDTVGINPYLKSLFSAVSVKDNDQDKILMKHGELIDWLIKHSSETPSVPNNWIHIEYPSNSAEIAAYQEEHTIYYT